MMLTGRTRGAVDVLVAADRAWTSRIVGYVEGSRAERTGVYTDVRSGVEPAAVDRTGVERIDEDRTGADRIDVERSGVDRTGVDRTGVERVTGVAVRGRYPYPPPDEEDADGLYHPL
ncbi:hypothetical protein [Dactylosporangium sp. NPDC005555]|uniref:hypothetical protein n=1 Tax=Dactylosporangium sp. NPDC005555 TaxID=3154889 RepID=UPI0033B3805D